MSTVIGSAFGHTINYNPYLLKYRLAVTIIFSLTAYIYSYFRLYGQFAMSTVISSAFGREVNILKGEADILTDAACELVTGYNERIPSLAITTALICKENLTSNCMFLLNEEYNNKIIISFVQVKL